MRQHLGGEVRQVTIRQTWILIVVVGALLLLAAILFGTSVMDELGHKAVDAGLFN